MDKTDLPDPPHPLPVAEPQLRFAQIVKLLGRDVILLLAIAGLIETGLRVGGLPGLTVLEHATWHTVSKAHRPRSRGWSG